MRNVRIAAILTACFAAGVITADLMSAWYERSAVRPSQAIVGTATPGAAASAANQRTYSSAPLREISSHDS